MQAELMAVSYKSFLLYGCVACGNKDVDLVIDNNGTRFYKCFRCNGHTEFLTLDKGLKESVIEVRVKGQKKAINPKRRLHPLRNRNKP